MNFPAIDFYGALVSPDLPENLLAQDAIGIEGQKAQDFGLKPNDRVSDEIALQWSLLETHWTNFSLKSGRKPDAEPPLIEIADHLRAWTGRLLEALGFQIEHQPGGLSVGEGENQKTFRINYVDNNLNGLPLVIAKYHQDLDRAPEKGGRRTTSPHGILQDYLNEKNTEHAFGLTTNGRKIRLLGITADIVRQTYIEFDLERIFDERLFADFEVLFRLLHASRFKRKGEEEQTLLEKYRQQAQEAGEAIREELFRNVKLALEHLGNGFLRHPNNGGLLASLQPDQRAKELHRLMLRLIYRLLFLMVAEERNLILPPLPETEKDDAGQNAKKAPDKASEHAKRIREIYQLGYSIARFRRITNSLQAYDRQFHDLWEQLKEQVFPLYYSPEDPNQTPDGQPFGIEPLNGQLFENEAKGGGLGALIDAQIDNEAFLYAMKALSWFNNPKADGQITWINYRLLNVEELGSVYEQILDLEPSIQSNPHGGTPVYSYGKGSERSSSGSHYTPEELVKPLADYALNPLIATRLQQAQTQFGSLNPKIAHEREQRQAIARQHMADLTVLDPACGSGHLLLNAARRIGTALAQAIDATDQPSPAAVRAETRWAIQHCLYGVDRNEMAVELCRVALWIEGHQPGLPLSFLDHRIRCGDSLVGIYPHSLCRENIPDAAFKARPGEDKELVKKLFSDEKAGRRKLEQQALGMHGFFDDLDPRISEEYCEFLQMDESTAANLRQKADRYADFLQSATYQKENELANAWVGAFFLKREKGNTAYPTSLMLHEYARHNRPLPQNLRLRTAHEAEERRFLHWALAFPEVFSTEAACNPGKQGFACILSNPPFLGGLKISTNLGSDYLSYLHSEYKPAKGTADLVAYFLRRIYKLLQENGRTGIITTNTIAQGDSREGGLDVITSEEQKGTIVYAERSRRWPGTKAAVHVSLLVINKGKTQEQQYLDQKPVDRITPYLDTAAVAGNPLKLKENENLAFVGSIVLGEGFILEPWQAQKLIEKDAKNAEALQPYLNGRDLNQRPDQSPSRWVINFRDWPLRRATPDEWAALGPAARQQAEKDGIAPPDYAGQVAADYPDLLKIVEEKVKPFRQERKEDGEFKMRKPLPQLWWIYGEKRPGLYRTIAPLERVLVISEVTKYATFTEISTSFEGVRLVYMHRLKVIAVRLEQIRRIKLFIS